MLYTLFTCKYVGIGCLQSVNIHGKRDPRHGVVNNQILDWSFKLDGIFHNSSQEVIYQQVAAPIVTKALEGYNGKLVQCHSRSIVSIEVLLSSIFVTLCFMDLMQEPCCATDKLVPEKRLQ